MIFGNSVNTMQEIPKTFCPAKWDELSINIDNNYMYGCCKATPVPDLDNPKTSMDLQKYNLLNNIQDPSCSYCWTPENKNLPSRRMHYLSKFDIKTLKDYNQNKTPESIEIYIGNECNFQCLYCNPKYSSKWYADVQKQQYKLFSDKFVYMLPNKPNKENDKFKKILELLQTYKTSKKSVLLGGEPFYNKKFFEIIDNIQTENLVINTNLSVTIDKLKTFIEKTKKFKTVIFNISLDADKQISEFVRYGLDYDLLLENLTWLIFNKPSNMYISIQSVMTSITVKNLVKFKEIVLPLLEKNPSMTWLLQTCVTPKFQSMSTLEDSYKPGIIDCLTELENNKQIMFADVVKSSILSSTFSKTLYNQQKIFVEEFAARKKITVPFTL